MFSTEDGYPIAIVKGGESNGEILFVDKENEKKKSVLKQKPIIQVKVDDGKFEQVPNSEVRVLYIAGPSGSGKSTYAATYIKKLKKIYPNSDFILFSRLKSDKVLDELDPHRIQITDELISDPIQVEDIRENSIILFDDIDCINNKKIMDSINRLRTEIMEIGRHKNLQIICTSHLINGNERKFTRTILNEMQSLTIFPKSGSAYQITYALKSYFGLSTKQIRKVLDMNSRWVTLVKVYPQLYLSEHELAFTSTL